MAIYPLDIRKDFPPLSININGNPPIYFDNACVTLKPVSVIKAITEYYNEFPACHGRSLHSFGDKTTQQYGLAREAIRRFINARKREEIIFTRNATEGINMLSNIIPLDGKAVLISELEHNSNLLPWQLLKQKKNIEYDIFELENDLTFSMENFEKKLNKNIGLVSIPHVSNVTGVTYPIEEIARIVHKNGALLIVDGAQAASSNPIDVQKCEVDFYVFSAHKAFGPSGVGCLYGRKGLLANYLPFMVGGETVLDTKTDSFTMADLPDKYEAGLQNYAGSIGFKAAIEYIEKLGVNNIREHMVRLNTMLSEGLKDVKDIKLIGPQDPNLRDGIFNFYIKDIDPFMITDIISRSNNIMLRCGKHCAHSWYNKYNIPDSIRASFSVYNTVDEVNIFIQEIKKIVRYYKR